MAVMACARFRKAELGLTAELGLLCTQSHCEARSHSNYESEARTCYTMGVKFIHI